jgi:plastocyanin
MKSRILVLTAAAVLAIAAALPASAAIFVVQQTSLTFSPDDITVTAGDTVRWVHSSLTHTVTSGTGEFDPEAGALFDAPLDATHPTFQYVFTVAGDVPYFCRPHEAMGMTGIVRVQPDPSVGVGNDVTGPGPKLLAPYPNPFNPRTVIAFELDAAGPAALRVYTLDGRSVRVLRLGDLPAGTHRAEWDGRDGSGKPTAAGTYVVRLDTAAGTRSRSVTLVK